MMIVTLFCGDVMASSSALLKRRPLEAVSAHEYGLRRLNPDYDVLMDVSGGILRKTRSDGDISRDIIANPPKDAAPLSYSRYAEGFGVAMDMVMPVSDGGVAQELYFDEGTVYMPDPVSMLPTGSCIKGEATDGGIMFNLPQCILALDEYDDDGNLVTYYYYLQLLKLKETEEGLWFYPVDGEDDENEFWLEADENGGYHMDCEMVPVYDPESGEQFSWPLYVVGITDEVGNWTGFGDSLTDLLPFEEQAVVAPSGVEFKDYSMTYLEGGQTVGVAIDGADVYVRGLCKDIPEGCIKGTIDNGKAVFPSHQYVGIDEASRYYTWFFGCDDDPDVQGSIIDMDAAVFDYDASTGDMKAVNSLRFAAGQDYYVSMGYYYKPMLRPFPEDMTYAPAAPLIEWWDNADPDMGFGRICFDLNPVNVDGYFLDVDKLEYSLLIDDQRIMFTPEQYVQLGIESEWVSAEYSDSWDIFRQDNIYVIYFYKTVEDSIGVQARYDKNGEYYYSDITSQNSGIDGVNADRAISSVHYTDLLGRRYSDCPTGISIKTVVYTDGTVESRKIVKR